MRCKKGDRVRIVGTMDDPAPMETGAEGDVTYVLNEGSRYEQAIVKWDNGRSLMLLPHDPFEVIR